MRIMVDFERIAEFCIDNKCSVAFNFIQGDDSVSLFMRVEKVYQVNHERKPMRKSHMFLEEDIEHVNQTGYLISYIKDTLKEMEETANA